MIGLDLEFLQRDNPLVLKEPNRFDEVRYSDLHYAGRLQALLSATRDNVECRLPALSSMTSSTEDTA